MIKKLINFLTFTIIIFLGLFIYIEDLNAIESTFSNSKILSGKTYKDIDNFGYRTLCNINTSYLDINLTVDSNCNMHYTYNEQVNENFITLYGNDTISFSLNARFNYDVYNELSKDDWVSKTNQFVDGYNVGSVGYGKIIILQSENNKDYELKQHYSTNLKNGYIGNVYSQQVSLEESSQKEVYVKIKVVYEVLYLNQTRTNITE